MTCLVRTAEREFRFESVVAIFGAGDSESVDFDCFVVGSAKCGDEDVVDFCETRSEERSDGSGADEEDACGHGFRDEREGEKLMPL